MTHSGSWLPFIPDDCDFRKISTCPRGLPHRPACPTSSHAISAALFTARALRLQSLVEAVAIKMRRRETLIERQPATRSICTSMAGKWAEVALKLIPCRMLAVWANHYSAYQQNVTEEVSHAKSQSTAT